MTLNKMHPQKYDVYNKQCDEWFEQILSSLTNMITQSEGLAKSLHKFNTIESVKFSYFNKSNNNISIFLNKNRNSLETLKMYHAWYFHDEFYTNLNMLSEITTLDTSGDEDILKMPTSSRKPIEHLRIT